MTAHIAPHRWADLWAGRVDEGERSEMEAHARSCKRCERIRQRVTRASDSFAAIRTQSSPDVPWDAVRARVHWSVSTERRAALRQRRPAYGWLAGAVATGVVVGLIVGVPSSRTPGPAPAAQRIAAPHTPGEPAGSPAAPLVGLVNRASGDVLIDGVRAAELFARQLAAGNRIATGDGRVDVQFGARSGFGLGPRSAVNLRRFDAEVVELVIDGTVDVDLAPRTGDQRFLVIAGDRLVEVHGTQLRVSHDSAGTTIACRHGLVTVSDGITRLSIGAARRVRIAHGRPLAGEPVVALTTDELAALAQATPLTLPAWDPGDPAALLRSSAPLEVAAAGGREVRVDGVELGQAPLAVRVMPGRHTVEAADSVGRFRRAGWVDVTAGSHSARLEIPAEPAPGGGIAERRRQLRAGLDKPRLRRCTRSIDKAGLTGTYVQIELAVDAHGAVGFLNVIDTDLPLTTASCVRDVLANVRFPRGAAATWRERIDL